MHWDSEGAKRKTDFHYWLVIGQLSYLAGTTHPNIQFDIHQCAQFCKSPKAIHKQGVKRIVRYLKCTADRGMILTINTSKGIDCYVDANYAGGYIAHKARTTQDCLSCTECIVKYANCPIIWCLKLQSTIALSITETEYMALSMAMHEILFLMNLIGEIRCYSIDLTGTKPTIKCNVYKGNSGAIELAKYQVETTNKAYCNSVSSLLKLDSARFGWQRSKGCSATHIYKQTNCQHYDKSSSQAPFWIPTRRLIGWKIGKSGRACRKTWQKVKERK